MLNTAAPVASGPLAAAATPVASTTNAPDGQAFSEALEHASAQQRDAAAGEDAKASGRDAGHAPAKAQVKAQPQAQARASARVLTADRPDATDLRAGADPCSAAPRQVDAGESSAAAVSDATPEDTTAPQAEGLLLQPTPDDGAAPALATDTHPLPAAELAAWVSALALPRPLMATAAATAEVTPLTTATRSRAGTAATAVAATEVPPGAVARNAQTLAGSSDAKDGAPSAPVFGAMAQAAPAGRADAPRPRAAPAAPADLNSTGRESTSAADPLMQAMAVQPEMAALPPQGADGSLAMPSLPGPWLGGALPRPLDAGTHFQAELHAPVGSKEFAPALGSQLSVLVRDGIEHAQLKLNPADMGPIEVRISLDGTQAQVDFSAAHAATRQALQDAVPALASALRENGLTLTGGGVFEQARDSRGDARPDPRGGGAARGHTADTPLASAPAPAPRMPRARGVVDLYA